MSDTKHVPDIMEVITDLSNDEVRTPPRVANQVLDLLPDEVWTNSTYRWLDPGTKSGVFLREATKRLMVGLKSEFPDEQERLEHILQNQMFGLAVTELSGLMARRALYCSKDASSQESIVKMQKPEGHIWQRYVSHPFRESRCPECGANQSDFGSITKENHAYALIHKNGREALENEFDMKFDVIVGNPPYQMNDEGGHRPVPIYNKFVEQVIALNPRYISMITPSRWMAGGLGLNEYRSKMLSDKRIRALVDFPVASELFPGVEIKGGVSYFLWCRDEPGLAKVTLIRGLSVVEPVERDLAEYDVFVRDARALPILHKVEKVGGSSFSEIVASVRPFGDQLRSNFKKYTKERTSDTQLSLYMNEGTKRFVNYVDADFVTNNQEISRSWKVFLPVAGSDGGQKLPDMVFGKGIVAAPGSVCTETYLAIGNLDSQQEAESLLSYLQTKFARFVVSLRKPGQHSVPSTFKWLPIQPWNQIWDDEQLYKKYNISEEEQRFISEMVKEMPSS